MDFPSETVAYRAARAGAAVFDRSARGRLLAAGRDRRSYLQGLVTNDIAALDPGRGCYAAYLAPQGRMIADLLVYELGDAILISTVQSAKDVVFERLDKFIFEEDVRLTDITSTEAQIAIVGPGAAALLAPLASVEHGALDDLPEHGCRRLTYADGPAIVTRITDMGVAGFDVYVPAVQGLPLRESLMDAGAALLSAADVETLRVEAGIPLFGRDMDEETIPLEAGIENRAISFTKGCYVGQEVIVRVLHRGQGRVARRLVGLRVDAQAPPAIGTAVHADGREVGVVTSSVLSPLARAPIALAYLPRELADARAPVTIDGTAAAVIDLPVAAGA